MWKIIVSESAVLTEDEWCYLGYELALLTDTRKESGPVFIVYCIAQIIWRTKFLQIDLLQIFA